MLKIDPERWDTKENWGDYSGIFIRALSPSEKWVNADICLLDKDSLLEFLRSRGEKNAWAENVVGILLGHGNLVE